MYDSNTNDTTTPAADKTVEAITRMNEIATEAGLPTYQAIKADLEALERRRGYTEQMNRNMVTKIETVHDWIKETIMSGSFDEDDIRYLAESIGFDMMVTKVLRIQLEVRVDVPMGSDMNDLDEDAVDITVRGTDENEVTDWEVTDCECEDF